MKSGRHGDAQIMAVLKQAEGGADDIRVSDVSAYGSNWGHLPRECLWLIVATEWWMMRMTTKSPGEKIVKDIKRATRKRYSSEEKTLKMGEEIKKQTIRKRRLQHQAAAAYSRTPRGMMFPLERSIHNRPAHIKDRTTFGEWEGDLMTFRREHDKANVASLVERKTPYAVLFRNNDRSSNHFMSRLMNGPVTV